jgi:hypothetical protein
MRRTLVVANKTLGGPLLLQLVRERVAEGPCSFYVLVPATSPGAGLTWTEEQARVEARERLDRELVRMRDLGAEVNGEVGSGDPMAAVLDVARHQDFDDVIVSTLPASVSRWLHIDLPRRVARALGVPTTHIVAELERVT